MYCLGRPRPSCGAQYVPKPVYQKLREIAFTQERKLHDVIKEGIDAALRKYGHPGVAALKEGAKKYVGGFPSRSGLWQKRAMLAYGGAIWYTIHMTTIVNKKARRTAVVPITTMEEVPMLSEEERADMVASLKAAEARIAAGQYVEHDPDTFVDRLMEVRAEAIRNKKA